MKWTKFKDIPPPEYDWVLVRDGEGKDSESGAITFARWTKKGGWEFFDHDGTERRCGPFHGDSYGFIDEKNITEWLYVDTWGN